MSSTFVPCASVRLGQVLAKGDTPNMTRQSRLQCVRYDYAHNLFAMTRTATLGHAAEGEDNMRIRMKLLFVLG